MLGAKIFVLQMKDVVKIGIFVLLGIIFLVVLSILLFGGGSQNQLPRARMDTGNHFVPGTYTATIVLNERPVDISVTVNETEITAIEMSELYESQRLLFPLFESVMAHLTDDMLFYQRADITLHNDHPVTTHILQTAVATALNQAAVLEP